MKRSTFRWRWSYLCLGALMAAVNIPTEGNAQTSRKTRTVFGAESSQSYRRQPRVLVLTDISSLTAGVREPDDGQSLIRLLLYANDLDIEGIIASSNMGHGQKVRPELIREAIAAYAKVRPNLLLHDKDYPPAERLLEVVKAGQPVAGPKVPVEDSVGEGKDTEASEWIIKMADKPDTRPLWVLAWGGTADLAQALWKVRQTRSPEKYERFLSKLRVHAIGEQDSTAAWIYTNNLRLFYINRQFGYRGMYRGGEEALASSEWVETHIRNGHGALGALYPNYNGGDIWSHRLGEVRGIKEGDTPSFLGLIPNGLNQPFEPTWGGWGGVFKHNGLVFTDVPDERSSPSDPDPRMSAVYRWRPDFQADFQARLDWCVKPFKEANHPPKIVVDRASRSTVTAGETLTLSAAKSSDPDGDRLAFHWTIVPELSDYKGPVALSKEKTSTLKLIGPVVIEPQKLHLLLTVRDNGTPPLTRYERVIVELRPKL